MRKLTGVSSRPAILLTAIMLLATACASSDVGETVTTAVDEDPTAEPSGTPPTSEAEPVFETIPLPDGLRPWWEGANRSQRFGDSNFVLTASSDVELHGENPGLEVLRIDDSFEWDTVAVAIPSSTTDADVFMTGTRLVISYLDPEGQIVVNSSEDGTTFAQTQLAVPDQYVEADEWEHTSLIGNLSGAADLNGSVFAVVNTGITWQRPADIAQAYAIEQDPAAAESIRYASTIRTNPTGDGDAVFVFEKSGEVVAEVLGSDAGIEPGYMEAWKDRSDDQFESQSWTIDGSSATNLNTQPFNGQAGLRVHSLYPVDGGVAAFVTDFDYKEEGAGASEDTKAFAQRGLAAPDNLANRAGGSEARFRTAVTADGIAWVMETAMGALNPTFGSLAWATYEGVPLFILVFFADGAAGVAASADGSTWSAVDYALDMGIGSFGDLQTSVLGPGTADIYSAGDESYRELSVEFGSDGTATVEETYATEELRLVFEGTGEQLLYYYLTRTPSSMGRAQDIDVIAGRMGYLLQPPMPTSD